MRASRTINYLKAAVIVHGKSEFQFVESVRSALRISIEAVGNNKGKSSIQIGQSLLNFLNTSNFKSMQSFCKNFSSVSVEGRGLNIKPCCQFRVFSIMDTDDCSLDTSLIESYKDKSFFKGHWLYNYIHPVYNTLHLEDVLNKGCFKVPENKNYNKYPRTYEQIVCMIDTFKDKSYTNIDEFLSFCVHCSDKHLKV